MLRRNRSWLLSGVAALAVACNAGVPSWSVSDVLDCDGDHLPGEFLRQTGGDFTASELAARGFGPRPEGFEQRPTPLGGSFSFWKEAVDHVPFDPPMHVVCQVLVFESEEGARGFVDALRADAAWLSRASIAWPEQGGLEVEETTSDQALIDDNLVIRTFDASTVAGTEPVRLVLAFVAEGPLMLAIYAGGPGLEPAIEDYHAALRGMREDAQSLTGERD
jgi:hypothetical protein